MLLALLLKQTSTLSVCGFAASITMSERAHRSSPMNLLRAATYHTAPI
jgi:hypothetical protein